MEDVRVWLGTLQFTDLLDVAVLWYVFYRTLTALRGTRAFQSLLGLALALVLYVVSGRLELFAVHWMLEKFFVYIVLAVLILFQSDIKRGLAGAGGRLFPSFATKAGQGTIEEMIRACTIMASRRIGALIAIEREASLAEYADGGSRVDAHVSSDLLMAIFHPTSPLHDGAVVVRNDRILAAKVFLPLSLSREVSRFYGTRHRAALGLAEETDAVILIVSEERGTIGVVMHGELHPVADGNELRERLIEALRANESGAPPRRGRA